MVATYDRQHSSANPISVNLPTLNPEAPEELQLPWDPALKCNGNVVLFNDLCAPKAFVFQSFMNSPGSECLVGTSVMRFSKAFQIKLLHQCRVTSC